MILFRNSSADFLMNAASPDLILNPNFVFVSKPEVTSSFRNMVEYALLKFIYL